MSQQEGLTGPFLIGTVVGGILGGILGVALASRTAGDADDVRDDSRPQQLVKLGKKGSPKATDTESIEATRRSLEDQIAQLNEAIDEVRQQLQGVHHNPRTVGEESEPEPLMQE